MFNKILLGATFFLLLQAHAFGLTVTVKTVVNVKTDDIPLATNTDWIINSPAGVSSLNPITVSDNNAYAHAVAAASANGGSIAVGARGHIYGAFDSTGGVGPADQVSSFADASATVTIDDLIFSGPGNSTTTNINIDVSGFLSGFPVTGGVGVFARSGSSMTLAINFNRGIAELSGGYFRKSEQNDFPQPPVVTETANADLEFVSFPETLTIGPFTVGTNTPYTLSFGIGVQATTRLLGKGEGEVISLADFGSTMSFPTSGPAFDLPSGYTVNSISADIVDNRWVGTQASVVVPVPPMAVLFAAVVPLLLRVKAS